MKKIAFVAVAILLIFVLSGCVAEKAEDVKQTVDNAELASKKCIELCQQKNLAGENLSVGPCISNQIIDDWVCDIAHSPRQDIDNQPENQCETYGNGTANHFVELDENCEIIKLR